MDLFVRECGPSSGPPLVLLHGGRLSGWSWGPVVERLPRYRCLIPDLPQFGKSAGQGPFGIVTAADAVAELISARADSAHVVGYSLGAQVGVQLLATRPGLVNRAVLCGGIINAGVAARPAKVLAGRCARAAWFRRMISRRLARRDAPIFASGADDYRADLALGSDAGLAHIVMASVGFTRPVGLGRSPVHAMFVSGAKETSVVRRCAAVLAESMPNGRHCVATNMGHGWPLRNPALFAETVDGWLSDVALPVAIRPARDGPGRRRGRSRR
ncbi:alpha/beta fold hydrolase [Mycolicibacterium iranicum]|uniref:AB hydrolase-1 domain-containing protein n=1 Tax=Mycolicibacterium iranicum TaxID=912594 RepID=A0A178LVN0_MYCIR|nr:alpha/beta hydrolase [Mycolicibacterium iranicum]OAN37608.1 hypothetical protein A4X20_22000 [Mycolicibacterium iranicum]